MQNRLFKTFRIPENDTHRRQYIKDLLNSALDNILRYNPQWEFRYETVEILSEKDENYYALPTDFKRIDGVFYDGNQLEIWKPKDEYKLSSLSASSPSVAIIRQRTKSPFANVGYVFPQYGSPIIEGQGTAFDTRMVGRFFKTQRDGEIYRIKAVNSTTQLTLDQPYGGASQAGTVSIYDGALTTVEGSPYITNFRSDMRGLRIKIEGNTNTFQITNVNVEEQLLTIDSNANAGRNLKYSIQDKYEIDPPNVYILEVYPAPSEDNKIIKVNYYALHPPLTGDYDEPRIPREYHNLIVYGAILEYASSEGADTIDLSDIRQFYKEGIIQMLNNEDPVESMDSVPDMVRFSKL